MTKKLLFDIVTVTFDKLVGSSKNRIQTQYVVCVFDKSLDAKHRDNVHMSDSWYIQLSSTLFKYVF